MAILVQNERARRLYRYRWWSMSFGSDDFDPPSSLTHWWDFTTSALKWQDAAQTTEAGEGDPIGAAEDRIGGVVVTQSTADDRPVFDGDKMTFDGSQYLQDGSITASAGCLILVVCTVDTTSDYIFDGAASGTRNAIYNSGSNLINRWGGSAVSYSDTYPTGREVILTARYGTDGFLRVNGHDEDGRSSAGGNTLGGLTIGAQWDGDTWLTGSIKHLMIFDSEPLADDLGYTEGFLNEANSISGYSDHKMTLGGDAGHTSAFDPVGRMYWRFGSDDVHKDVIQWVNIDNWVCGTVSDTIANSGGWAVWYPPGKCFYIYGGRTGGTTWDDTVFKFNPRTDTLTTATETLPAARSSLVGGYYDGKIYLFGGNVSPGTSVRDTIWVHDPDAGTITDTTATLPAGNAAMGIAWADDVELFYLVGGNNGSGTTSVDTIVTYDPSTPTVDAVDTGEVIGTPLENQACAYAPDQGAIYCINGFNYAGGGVYSNSIHKIVTATNTVTTLSETGHRVDDDGNAFYDPITQKIYAGPFLHSDQVTDNSGPDKREIYEFDPATETLTPESQLTAFPS